MGDDKPAVPVRQITQVCVVVRDIQAAMEHYWKILGIGPWRIHTFEPPGLTNTTIHGGEQPYTMKLAVAEVGDVQWELVEPLEGPSIYKEFLDERGEGLHHVKFAVDDYDEAVSAFGAKKIGVLMSGTFRGGTFAYMETEDTLGMIAEITKRAPDAPMPAPEATYPSEE